MVEISTQWSCSSNKVLAVMLVPLWCSCEVIEVCIVACWQLLMSTLADNIVRFIHKMGIVPLSTVMQLLVDMVTTDAEDGCASAQTVSADDSCQMLVSLCRTMVPDSFIRLLLDQIASEMVISLIFIVCYWPCIHISVDCSKCDHHIKSRTSSEEANYRMCACSDTFCSSAEVVQNVCLFWHVLLQRRSSTERVLVLTRFAPAQK